MTYLKNYLMFLVAFFIYNNVALAENTSAQIKTSHVPTVVVSIKPVHSWVSAVMDGVGTPYLLLKNSDSVHNYSLKPSDAKAIAAADLIFITDRRIENYLQRPLKNLIVKGKVSELAKAPNVHLLPAREGGMFEPSHHHKLINYNFHFWMDPKNAVAAVREIARLLSEKDPVHKEQYQKNAEAYAQKLLALIDKTKERLGPHPNINFIVFHDAYYYYEKRFGVEALGSVTINPQHRPGAKRINMIRNKIKSLKAVCIYTEPQFSPSIVKTLIENTKAKQGTLDPIGVGIPAGKDEYEQLIDKVTDSLLTCAKEH